MNQRSNLRYPSHGVARLLAVPILCALVMQGSLGVTAARAESSPPAADLGQSLSRLSPDQLESLLAEEEAVALVLASGERLEMPMARLAGAIGYTYRPLEPCRAGHLSLRAGETLHLDLGAGSLGAEPGCGLPAPSADGETARPLAVVLSLELTADQTGQLGIWSATQGPPHPADALVGFRGGRTGEHSVIVPLCGLGGGAPCGLGALQLRAEGGSVEGEARLLGYFLEAVPSALSVRSPLASALPQSGSSCTSTFAICRSPTGASSGCSCATSGTCGAICSGLTVVTNNIGSSCSVSSTYGGCSANDSTCPLSITCRAACCECEL